MNFISYLTISVVISLLISKAALNWRSAGKLVPPVWWQPDGELGTAPAGDGIARSERSHPTRLPALLPRGLILPAVWRSHYGRRLAGILSYFFGIFCRVCVDHTPSSADPF